MSAIFIYAIKSAICLAMLYLPYTLLMRRDTFYSLNRKVLMGIVLLALVLPALDLPVFDNGILSGITGKGRAIIEIGMPQAAIEGAGHHIAQPNPVDVSQEWSVLLVQMLLLIYIMILNLSCLSNKRADDCDDEFLFRALFCKARQDYEVALLSCHTEKTIKVRKSRRFPLLTLYLNCDSMRIISYR